MCETKKCVKCLKDKDLSEFNKNKSKKCGVASVCKECHSEYRKEHYLKNKDKVLEQVKHYNTNHPEFVRNQKINRFSKKAGRTCPKKCEKCDNLIYQTKKDFDLNKKGYCSNECKKLDNKTTYYHYLKQIEKRVDKNKKEFDLDELFLKELLEIKQNNRCNVTNIPIKLKNKGDETMLHETASLDRIDSSKGYTKDNVQWVCLGINYMKLDYSNDELLLLIKLIKENYKD